MNSNCFNCHIRALRRNINVVDGYIIATTEKVEDVEYAFYLYSNRKIINKTTYGSEPICYFDLNVPIESVSIKFFYIRKDDKVTIKKYWIDSNSLEYLIEITDEDFFEDNIILLEDKDIFTLIRNFQNRYSSLSNKLRAYKYVQFINYSKNKDKSLINSSLQTLSQLSVMLYEDRYTLMCYAGICAAMVSIQETNESIVKLEKDYQVDTDKINKIWRKLQVGILQHTKLLDNIINSEFGYNTNGDFFKGNDEQLLSLLMQSGAEGVVDFLKENNLLDNKTKASLALKVAKIVQRYKEDDVDKFKHCTQLLAEYAYNCDKSEGTLRNIYFAYQRIHNYDKLNEIRSLLYLIAGDNPSERQRKLLWSSPDHLMTIVDKVPTKPAGMVYTPMGSKVCYVIHNSLPYSSGGYATRGHGLLTALTEQGVNIFALTRPGYPHDISQIRPEEVVNQDIIDGVVYKRILSPSRRDYSNYEYMLRAAESYKQVFLDEKPALIIAASNHLDGLPAMFAARELGIPFIYEIRGFWEITRLSKYPEFEQDPMYAVEKQLEATVAKYADHIFTLTQGMIDELEDRGVDTQGRITLLPNSCNIERFNPMERDIKLATQLDIPATVPVIGYVGTLVSYEGLDDLAIACGRLKQAGYEFRLLIVGNENATGQGKGSITTQVQNIATTEGYEDWLIMPGRVPFEEVESYYSLIDIAPFPRKAWPVCEIVPPMKTLEALSMKKAVVVSSNKALTEMITHDVNGRIYERGSIDGLTEELCYLLDHPEIWASYGEAGRIFVENERTWKRTAEKATSVINSFQQ